MQSYLQLPYTHTHTHTNTHTHDKNLTAGCSAAPLPTARSPHADPNWMPRFNRSPQRSVDASRAPGSPEDRAARPLNAALLPTLGHPHRLLSILGPLRDQLRTLNQHVEQLRGAFCKTVSLAVGFVLGSAAAVGFIRAMRPPSEGSPGTRASDARLWLLSASPLQAGVPPP